MRMKMPMFALRFPIVFRWTISLAFMVMPSGLANAQSGGGYVITRSTVDGGGGPAAGGDYHIAGTAGQPATAPVSGDEYVLRGGFWSPAVTLDSPEPPSPDPTGISKSRFLSFLCPQTPISPTAFRVVLISLHHVVPPYSGGPSTPFTSFEGQERWIGPPVQYTESFTNPLFIQVSRLQCTPYYHDWSTIGLLHVTGSAIVPSSRYGVEILAAPCQGQESSPPCLSGGSMVTAQLQIQTTRWGDVETPYNPPDVTIQPDLTDVFSLLSKFRSAPEAPIKARALLVGGDLFGEIDVFTDFSFIHISACVDAFRGQPYPHEIAACP